MLKKKYSKPKFIHPIIFKFFKFGRVNFFNMDNVNLRSSSYLRYFTNNVFPVHNGKFLYSNDPVKLSIIFKEYPFFNFKLGQFSYTRSLLDRRSNGSVKTIIVDDLKRKRGLFIRNKNKRKKFVFRKKR